MSTLKERIAALQANSGLTPPGNGSSRSSSPSSSLQRSPSEHTTGSRLSEKIARFDRLGGAPLPRGGIDLGASPPPTVPLSRSASHSSDYWSKQLAADHKPGRSASIRLPRVPSEEQNSSPSMPRPFDVVKLRSPPTPISISSQRRMISPQVTGEPLNLPKRPQVLRSESPTPSPKGILSSTEGTKTAVGPVPNLPASPPTNIIPLVAAPGDLKGEKADITAVGAPDASVSSSAAPSSAVDAPPSQPPVIPPRVSSETASSNLKPSEMTPATMQMESSANESPSPVVGSSSPPTSIPSSPAQPLVPSMTGASIESGPRPSTPSYLAQAVAYFPPARSHNRQSSLFQVPTSIRSLSPTPPSPPCPPSILSLNTSHSTASESPKNPPLSSGAGQPKTPPRRFALTPEPDSVRTSMDTAYFSVDNENEEFVFLASAVEEGASRRLDSDVLAAMPKTPTASSSSLISSQSPPALPTSTTVAPQSNKIIPVTPQEPTTVNRAASLRSIQAKLGLFPKKTSSGSIKSSGTRRKSALLIPGKWIGSDDDDDDDVEEEGKGWARIVVGGKKVNLT